MRAETDLKTSAEAASGLLPGPRPAETDLKTLADAANEAAKREAAQWFYFVTIMLTLAAIVGSTTHRVLFLEEPVKVPLLGVDLPLRGFYVAAPAILVVLHFYLLAQMGLMAAKVQAFLDAAHDVWFAETEAHRAARARELARLDTFSVTQLVAADRYGHPAVPVRAMAWVTLIMAPIGLLLFFQLRFLPFHSEAITWWHRVLLAVDVGLLLVLWPTQGSGYRVLREIRRAGRVAALAVILFAIFVATIPDEQADVGGRHMWLRTALFGDLSYADVGVDQRSITPISRRLILPDQDFVPEDDKARGEVLRTRVLRGRRLGFAVLDRADLRKADLSGAFLGNALLRGAQLDGALLDGAHLQSAALVDAQLQGASLINARLEGAVLEHAELQGATLNGAQLQGASLGSAALHGAVLDNANLQFAYLDGAQLQGASLDGAQLQGARLDRAQLQGASLVLAQLQGASLEMAHLNAATLDISDAWRVRAPGAVLEDTLLGVRFDARPPCSIVGESPDICPRNRSWEYWIESSVATVPEGSWRNFARRRLAVLLPLEIETLEMSMTRAAWRAAPEPEPARVAETLGKLACDPNNAPYVSRSVLRQIENNRHVGAHRAALAAQMLHESCSGARGLSVSERGRLRAIAQSRN